MNEEFKKYLDDWFFDSMGISVRKGKPNDVKFTVCDIRGWGYFQTLGEQEGITVQEFVGKFIADAPKTIKSLLFQLSEKDKEIERLKRIIDPQVGKDVKCRMIEERCTKSAEKNF